MVILYFSKAFDEVPHQRLKSKLHHYEVGGNNLSWISSFLGNRSQKVVVDSEVSEIGQVISGVPQRSVLGPV